MVSCSSYSHGLTKEKKKEKKTGIKLTQMCRVPRSGKMCTGVKTSHARKAGPGGGWVD